MTAVLAEHPRCPTCGHQFTALPRIDATISALGLVGDQKRLFTILAAGRGRYLTIKEIVSILWDGDEDGGPNAADKSIHVHIARLRAALASYPLVIEGGRSKVGGFSLHGWSIACMKHEGYQLVPTREAAA